MLMYLDSKSRPIYCAVQELANLLAVAYPAPKDAAGLNRLFNPIGQMPARGWFLIERAVLNQIDLNGTLTVNMEDEDGNRLTASNLIVAAEPYNICPGKSNDDKAIFVVEVADQRWTLNDESIGVAANKFYNMPAPGFFDAPSGLTGATSYMADSLNAGTPWTWLTLVQDLWGLMPQLGSAPSALPTSPDGKPTAYLFPGMNAYAALNQVLWRLGLGIKWDPFVSSNQYSLVQIGAADAAADSVLNRAAANNQLIFDREFQPIVRGQQPNAVKVFFQAIYARGTENTTGRVATSAYIPNSEYGTSKPNTASGADPNSVHALQDDLPALYDAGDSLQNASALSTRAQDRATTYLRMLAQVKVHKIFTGLLMDGGKPFLPGSSYRGVSWGQDLAGIGDQDGAGGLSTEVIRYNSWALGVSNGGQWDEYDGDMGSTWLRTPDYGPTDPNYPVHLQKIRLTTGTADGNGVFTGYVQRYNPVTRTFSDMEACVCKEQNGLLVLTYNKRYDGRLSGYDPSSLVPVYTISGSSGTTPYSLSTADTYNLTITTTLVNTISAGAVALDVTDHAQFPTDYRFKIQINSEKILVGITGGGTTWALIERGIDGTTAAGHTAGATITWVVPDEQSDVNKITVDYRGFVFPQDVSGTTRGAIHPITDQDVEIVSGPTAAGYYDGYRLEWDSTTKTWTRAQAIWIRDLDT